ncbi:MAG: hypothetical protein ACRD2J_07950 [Thermoanaerobaculia bacterium]
MKTALLLATLLVVALILWWVAPLVLPPELTTLEDEPALVELLERAPAGATNVIAVPSFAPAWRRFDSILGPLVGEGARTGLDAAAWVAGGAPLVAWEGEETWGAVARPDPLRRLVIRLLGGLSGADVRVDGATVFFGPSPSRGAPMGEIPALAPGHLFLLHRDGATYPPMPRPAWSAVRVIGDRVEVTTIGTSDRPRRQIPLAGTSLPRGALLAARVAEPPEAIAAIDEVFPLPIGRFLEQGGLVALYGVDRGGLVPVPRLVFGIPADDARAAEIVELIDRATLRGAARLLLGRRPDETRQVAGTEVTRRRGIGLTIEFARREGEFLIAFDDETLPRLLEDGRVPAGKGGAVWVMRARVRELLPAAEALGYSDALRLLAPDFASEARELAETLRRAPPAREVRAVMRQDEERLRLEAELALQK